jgi:hypothetical protein
MRMVMLAMIDLSKALGHPFEYEPAEVWRALDSIVEKADKRKIAVAANMGYDYTTHERMLARVRRMQRHGVRACPMQGADNMLANFARPLLPDICGTPSWLIRPSGAQASHCAGFAPSTGDGLSQYGLVSDMRSTGPRCLSVPWPPLDSIEMASSSAGLRPISGSG